MFNIQMTCSTPSLSADGKRSPSKYQPCRLPILIPLEPFSFVVPSCIAHIMPYGNKYHAFILMSTYLGECVVLLLTLMVLRQQTSSLTSMVSPLQTLMYFSPKSKRSQIIPTSG